MINISYFEPCQCLSVILCVASFSDHTSSSNLMPCVSVRPGPSSPSSPSSVIDLGHIHLSSSNHRQVHYRGIQPLWVILGPQLVAEPGGSGQSNSHGFANCCFASLSYSCPPCWVDAAASSLLGCLHAQEMQGLGCGLASAVKDTRMESISTVYALQTLLQC